MNTGSGHESATREKAEMQSFPQRRTYYFYFLASKAKVAKLELGNQKRIHQ